MALFYLGKGKREKGKGKREKGKGKREKGKEIESDATSRALVDA